MDKYNQTFFAERIESINNIVEQLSNTINYFRNFYKPNKTVSRLTCQTNAFKMNTKEQKINNKPGRGKIYFICMKVSFG